MTFVLLAEAVTRAPEQGPATVLKDASLLPLDIAPNCQLYFFVVAS